MKNNALLFLAVLTVLSAKAEKQIHRTGVSLNGSWYFTPENQQKSSIEVPDYWDAYPKYKNVKNAVYERSVLIPKSPDWIGKIIKLEFEAVNFIADVYINNKLIGSHTGAWMPFSFDITKVVKPGVPFILKVDVKGGCFPPIVDASGAPQWPVGFTGQEQRWGIIFDVLLRAYGEVYTADAFIQTSFRNKKIKIDYQFSNSTDKTRTVFFNSTIFSTIDSSKTVLSFEKQSITLVPGETKTIAVEQSWNNPRCWTPNDPFLYYLKTELIDAESKIPFDIEYQRFGFREVWTEGNKLMFNGHRFNMLGATIVQHSEFHETQRYYYMTPESWNTSVDRLKELNIGTVRFHMQPPPQFILDICDERGLLVIEESAIYAREYVLKTNKEEYLKNCYSWIEPWVKANRNHPSIVIWNAENEMGVGWLRWMTSAEIKSLGDEIRKYDNTRPVNYDGDADVGDALVNYHYPESYSKSVTGSIYSWSDSVYKDKPTGVGEFITHYGDYGIENQWWMGTWVRGMRYVNFSDIRPYRHDWAWIRSDNTPAIQNLINGYAPVALFDKSYDDLGIEPLRNKNYPPLNSGDTVNRTLVLYNDEFEDTVISIEVLIKSSEIYQALYNYNGDRAPKQKIIAEGSRTYIVPLGEHVDIPCSFVVPEIHEGFIDYFDVELITRKKGIVKFRETIRFVLMNKDFTGETSSKVNLYQARKSEIKNL